MCDFENSSDKAQFRIKHFRIKRDPPVVPDGFRNMNAATARNWSNTGCQFLHFFANSWSQKDP